jgi:hypothetical protein
MPADDGVDLGGRLLAAHAMAAVAELVQLAELAERLGRLGEVPSSAVDCLNDLPAAVQRWWGDERST